MAIVPTPERGQPIDLSYISSLATAINTLSEQISPATYKFVTVENSSTTKTDRKSSELRMYAVYAEVVNNSAVTASTEKEFSYDLTGFGSVPVVTATPINISGTAAGSDVSVTIRYVSTSQVKGIVRFNSGGTATVGVNIIAIGLPA